MAALTTKLEGALEDFLDHCRTERSGPYDYNDAFCLIEFLAEAILNAEHNESQGLPALACMFERLDEHLDTHLISSEARQCAAVTCFDSPESRILSHEVFAWFDAPSNPSAWTSGTGL